MSVIVYVDGGIDVVPVLFLPYQRFTKRVFEGSVWRIAHQNADAMAVKRCIEIILTVALDGLDGPRPVVARPPCKVFQRCYGTMLCPVDHVGCRPKQPVVHEKACRTFLVFIGNVLWRSVVRCVEEQGIADHKRRRVCSELCLEERHVDLLQSSHLPPVKVEELGAFSACKHEI